jgi:heat shock protein HtpX
MAALDRRAVAKHRLINTVQTASLIGIMMLLLGLIAELLLGEGAFLWSALLTGALLLLSPRLPPSVILRLYRARPLSPRTLTALHAIVRLLASRAALPAAPSLYYVPSAAANAFAVGNRRRPAIALTDGLLRRLDLRELAGVLAHEISHLQNNDLRVMALADTVSRLTGVMSLFGQILIVMNLPLLMMGRATVSWIGLLLLIAAPSLAALLQLALSRAREFQADLGAAELTGDPKGLASALAKIDYHASPWFERIFRPSRKNPDPSILRSHPRLESRIRRLLELSPHAPEELIGPELIYSIPEEIPVITHRPSRHWSGVWY